MSWWGPCDTAKMFNSWQQGKKEKEKLLKFQSPIQGQIPSDLISSPTPNLQVALRTRDQTPNTQVFMGHIQNTRRNKSQPMDNADLDQERGTERKQIHRSEIYFEDRMVRL
jgi:hypothetical protein